MLVFLCVTSVHAYWPSGCHEIHLGLGKKMWKVPERFGQGCTSLSFFCRLVGVFLPDSENDRFRFFWCWTTITVPPWKYEFIFQHFCMNYCTNTTILYNCKPRTRIAYVAGVGYFFVSCIIFFNLYCGQVWSNCQIFEQLFKQIQIQLFL